MNWQITDRTLSFSQRPLIMGIVNVTPDSFSDGGKFWDTNTAIAHSLRLVEQGADILDIGGESTRPGSQPVLLQEELNRVLPVVERLASECKIPISIDTSKATVAEKCIAAGAHIINDVTAMNGDPNMAAVVAATKAGVVLMHMQGTPATMQDNPRYENVVAEVISFLKSRIEFARAAGIAFEQIAVDPGIGFGKTFEHNLALLAELHQLRSLQRPICLGVSRKRFIRNVIKRDVGHRLAGSLAVTCHAMMQDAAQIVRVHDVQETLDAVLMIKALQHAYQ